MRTAIAHLRSTSTYGQSKQYGQNEEGRAANESFDEYERRTWKERGHWDKDGQMFIPPIQFKNALTDAAGLLNEKIPGQGNKKWKSHFVSGVMVTEGITLAVTRDSVEGIWVGCSSTGAPGGGRRVQKCFPIVPSWEGKVTFYILDDEITKEVFEKHLRTAGLMVGIGYWRGIRGGTYGRFEIASLSWGKL